MKLVLERRGQTDESPVFEAPDGSIAVVMPPIDEDYWAYRVKLSDNQAMLGFPKFGLIGIGFAKEEDWNSNLPSSKSSERIFDHIGHNKGDDEITDEDCITAIEMIQTVAKADKESGLGTGGP